jgi:hypothetical protein
MHMGLSSTALIANTGTPLMWAAGLHLVIGNLFIGIFEGLLLGRFFRLKRSHAVIVMILANYFSMIAGAVSLDSIQWFLESYVFPGPPIFHAGSILITLAVVSYSMSILLEWPACTWLLRKGPRPWRQSLFASAIVQSCSYAVLVPFYASCTTISMITQPDLQSNLGFVDSKNTMIYFINPGTHSVNRCRANGSERESVLTLPACGSNDRLFLNPRRDSNDLDLWWVHDDKKNDLLIPHIATRGEPLRRKDYGIEPDTWGNVWWSNTTSLPADKSERPVWTAHCGFWAVEGLAVSLKGKWQYRLAMETPFSGPFLWACRNAVSLSDTQVLFQTQDQLLILDMPSKKLSFLATGRGPVVVFPDH